MALTPVWTRLRVDAADPDEARLARWVAQPSRRVEPYWLLADRMGYAGFERAWPRLPVMIEHAAPVTAEGSGRAKSRFELAWKQPRDLFALIDRDPAAIRAFQLDAPRAVGPEASTAGGTLDAQSIDERLDPTRLVAVIDDGLPFAHPGLLERSPAGAIAPRFESIWDQADRPAGVAPPWTAAAQGYGALLDKAAMQTLVGATYAGLDEARAYAKARYPVRDGRTSHGCGVTHLLAGSDVALTDGARRDFAAWSATPIFGIQLPRPKLEDTAGAWLGFYALAALRHAVNEATTLTRPLRWHLVANLSYGSLAGPHDGSSMFERAVDELIEWAADPRRRFRLDVVMASGNSRHLPVHAVAPLAAGGSAHPRCVVPPDNPHDCQYELWLPEHDDGGAPFDPAHLELTVTPPDGPAQVVTCGSAHLLHAPGAALPCAGVVFAPKVAQGLYGTMVALVVKPTVCNGAANRAPAGRWTLDVRSTHGRPVTLHLRAERNDLVGRTRRAQQARVEGDPQGTSFVTADGTLSHCAHGKCVTVGGAVRQDSATIRDYTGRGWANGRMRPDWYAPGDVSAALRGVLVPGLLAGQMNRMSGTSIAAPWIARWCSSGSAPAELRPTFDSDDQIGPPMLRTVRAA